MTTLSMVITSHYSDLASNDQIERTKKALEANNIHVIVADNGDDAKNIFFAIFPVNAEVFTSTSVTLKTLGISDELDKTGHYNSVRRKLTEMDADTQNREMQKMGATPEYMIGSVHAVTETGRIIIASKTGSQLAGYVSGAERVIWVVGTQKIVPTLEDGMLRIEQYTLPLEDSRAYTEYRVKSSINKLLIINREFMPGRITMILVKENIGF